MKFSNKKWQKNDKKMITGHFDFYLVHTPKGVQEASNTVLVPVIFPSLKFKGCPVKSLKSQYFFSPNPQFSTLSENL